MSVENASNDSKAAGETGAADAAKPGAESAKPAEKTQDKGSFLVEGKKEATAEPGKADSKVEGDKAEADKSAPAEVEIKLPDGVDADKAFLDGFKSVAKELGLKSDGAQKLADLYVKSHERAVAAQQQAREQRLQSWEAEIKADKEIGGPNLEANRKAAQLAVRKFGSEKVIEFLSETGLGNHPELARLFAKVGKALGEDKASDVAGGPASAGPKNPFEDIYTTMKSKE